MSIKLKLDEISEELKTKIHNDLTITINSNKFAVKASERYVYAYEIVDEYIYIPFYYGINIFNKDKRPPRNNFTPLKISFKGTLRPEQEIVKKEAVDLLNKNSAVIISTYTGFGKTIGAIDIAVSIKLKTLIVIKQLVLKEQWIESINKFCPDAIVKYFTPKSKDSDCDFGIMSAQNIQKLDRSFFKSFGTVIVDEVHTVMAESLSKSMYFLNPRYAIALSATSYRPDAFDGLIDLVFGTKKVFRQLNRPYLVYKIDTGFKPIVELSQNGRINWGTLLDSQANSKERNELIIKIIKHFKERSFLVLTKRVEQAKYLNDRFIEEKELVTMMIGNKQTYDDTKRILIATYAKGGCGFDAPRYDTLLLAGDISEYFSQNLGRALRRVDSSPIIFDLLDKNPILMKHFMTRVDVYKNSGGKIENLKIDF